MSTAQVCDLTGEIESKAAQRHEIEVALGDTKRVLVYVQTRKAKGDGWDHGHFGARAAKEVEATVRSIVAKLDKAGK